MSQGHQAVRIDVESCRRAVEDQESDTHVWHNLTERSLEVLSVLCAKPNENDRGRREIICQ